MPVYAGIILFVDKTMDKLTHIKKHVTLFIARALLIFGAFSPIYVSAAIVSSYTSNVSPVSFSVVIASDSEIANPAISVYSDAEGNNPLTVDFEIISNSFHHQNGVAVLRVNSLDSSTRYFFSLSANDGLNTFPTTGLDFIDTKGITETNPYNVLHNSDLFKVNIFRPNLIDSLEGAVLLLNVLGQSTSTVLSFINSADEAYIDSSNLISEIGERIDTTSEVSLEIKVVRGLLCADVHQQLQVFYRKSGGDTNEGIQVQQSNNCRAEDPVCDDEVNVLDVQFVLNSLNSTPEECRFTRELDVVEDQQINVLDVQQILNFF
jgi:hypothetical protein